MKVTPDGTVKVLDFGLAKAFGGEQDDSVELSHAAHMGPEQAEGKTVDQRVDLWAFGVLLYENLTGRQAWTGTTVTDILAAALAQDPDFSVLPPNIRPRIRELLSRCLQKDPTERFRDVGDVRVGIYSPQEVKQFQIDRMPVARNGEIDEAVE